MLNKCEVQRDDPLVVRAGGERVGYDPKARAMVATEDAPLRIFMHRAEILAQGVSFLPTKLRYMMVPTEVPAPTPSNFPFQLARGGSHNSK